ncbi:acetyltransferase [Proteus myxofaciens]|uniref:Acetyltransferase n=1 Tax=Proteus myxofaciens ATCC 19692 TaxID=1354337 RepID=A0A198GBK9_9GAMM|nr:acetyltransferase [Proteus myxofaciens]OAT34817.1 acetyltransferase [Proteus myxofaciens ATCC 19692]
MNYTFRKMIYEDLSSVTQLLQANSTSQHGGLYGEYPYQKVEAMYQSSTNTIIALFNQKIVAVVFSFPVTSLSLPPIARQIHLQFPQITKNNWFYGPVCIDKRHRGKSLLLTIYQHICALQGGHPVAFINSENIPSLKAHKKIGMQPVTSFKFEDKLWWIMVGN